MIQKQGHWVQYELVPRDVDVGFHAVKYCFNGRKKGSTSIKQYTSTRLNLVASMILMQPTLLWLKLLNAERARAGAPPVTEDQLERVIEELE
ncbi:hypothetical protein EVAR_70599_1, partial [Eumeta japonica]